MYRVTTSWFQGWKISLRCAEFTCQDGSLKFACTAFLNHLPPSANCTSMQWPERRRRSIVFPEDAFGTREDANADATSRARREIQTMNGSKGIKGRKIMEDTRDTGARKESDESLAARFEITFDGRRYAYREHRYDVFLDALRFSVAEHAQDGFVRNDAFQPSWLATFHPTDDDEALMREHGIVYVAGHYLYGGYRYGQLCDAIVFAAAHPNC